MNPSYQELIRLNPRLAERPKEEVLGLVQAIRACGYQWDSSERVFFHPGLSRSVRTQGLDLFTATRFREAHQAQLAMATSHPEAFRLESEYKGLLGRVPLCQRT